MARDAAGGVGGAHRNGADGTMRHEPRHALRDNCRRVPCGTTMLSVLATVLYMWLLLERSGR